MASELAKQLARELPDASFIGPTLLKDYGPRERLLDAAFENIRGVLDALSFNELGDGPCWCADSHPSHECQRARALYERLKP